MRQYYSNSTITLISINESVEILENSSKLPLTTVDESFGISGEKNLSDFLFFVTQKVIISE
jgi:hypothetical protein